MSAKTIDTTRCCARDQDGKQCRKPATHAVTIFQDPEMRDYGDAGWFWVPVCRPHGEKIARGRRDDLDMLRPIQPPKPRRKR